MIYHNGYNSKSKGYKTNDISYKAWTNMLKRCYSDAYHRGEPSYSDCSVCDEWKDYQNYAEWYNKNIYSADELVCLDKDLRVKGNKLYSPDTCVFLPVTLNKLLINTSKSIGEYPVGVSYHKHNNKFVSYLSTPMGRRTLGYFDSEDEAFSTYKVEKEQLIKDMAEKYKSYLPIEVYNLLISYEI
jgi:hypothetical protein